MNFSIFHCACLGGFSPFPRVYEIKWGGCHWSQSPTATCTYVMGPSLILKLDVGRTPPRTTIFTVVWHLPYAVFTFTFVGNTNSFFKIESWNFFYFLFFWVINDTVMWLLHSLLFRCIMHACFMNSIFF